MSFRYPSVSVFVTNYTLDFLCSRVNIGVFFCNPVVIDSVREEIELIVKEIFLFFIFDFELFSFHLPLNGILSRYCFRCAAKQRFRVLIVFEDT